MGLMEGSHRLFCCHLTPSPTPHVGNPARGRFLISMATPRKRPEERLKMGRPTVVTPEVLAKLEQAFGMGCSDKEACLYADISMDALYNHQNRNPHFAEWKALLKEKPVLKARNTVVQSLSDPENAKWYLERKTHGEFNARAALELTGKDGGPISVSVIRYEQ